MSEKTSRKRKAVVHKIVQVPLDSMFIHYSDEGGYQRAKREERVIEIAENFEPHRFEPVTLSLRSDGRYAIVEGQTRYWVAVLLEIPALQSIVHEGMSLEEEARLFIDLNGPGRQKASAYARYKAAITAGDPVIVGLNALIESCGWRVIQGRTEGRVIRAVTELETAHRRHGSEPLQTALWLLEPWSEDNVPSGAVLHGMVDFVAEYADKIDLKKLRGKLEKIPAATIERRAKAKAGGTGIGMHTYIALEILAEWNKHKRKGRHLEALSNAA